MAVALIEVDAEADAEAEGVAFVSVVELVDEFEFFDRTIAPRAKIPTTTASTTRFEPPCFLTGVDVVLTTSSAQFGVRLEDMPYADTWDDDRGMMILEWGGKPEYHAWPDQPTFRTVTLSRLIDEEDTLIKPKQHLRVTLDIDITYEEASFIKEKFIADYDIRELTLITEKKAVEINTDIDIQAFESVDQIVSNQIVSIDSDTYDKNILLSIYNSL